MGDGLPFLGITPLFVIVGRVFDVADKGLSSDEHLYKKPQKKGKVR